MSSPQSCASSEGSRMLMHLTSLGGGGLSPQQHAQAAQQGGGMESVLKHFFATGGGGPPGAHLPLVNYDGRPTMCANNRSPYDAACMHPGAFHGGGAPHPGGSLHHGAEQQGGPFFLNAPRLPLPSLPVHQHAGAGLSFPSAPQAQQAHGGLGMGGHQPQGASNSALSLALLQAFTQQQQHQAASQRSDASSSAMSNDLLRSWGGSGAGSGGSGSGVSSRSSTTSASPPNQPSHMQAPKSDCDLEAQHKTAMLEYENEVLRQRLQHDSAEKMNLVQLLFNQIQQNSGQAHAHPCHPHQAHSVASSSSGSSVGQHQGQHQVMPPSGMQHPMSVAQVCGMAGLAEAAAVVEEKTKPVQSRYWTDAEHQRFLDAVQRFGAHDHKAIAMVVGTRTSSQVRSHSQKFFKKVEQHKGSGIPNMNRKKKERPLQRNSSYPVDVEG